jgi:hypothetical protein
MTVKSKVRALPLTNKQIKEAAEKMKAPAKEKPEMVPIDLQTYLHKTMTKELSLNISERLAARAIFDSFQGNIKTTEAIIEDRAKVGVAPEEWTKAGLKKTPTDEEIALLSPEDKKTVQQAWNWTDEGSEKEVTLSSEAVEYLIKTINEKSEAGQLTVRDSGAVGLSNKLNA